MNNSIQISINFSYRLWRNFNYNIFSSRICYLITFTFSVNSTQFINSKTFSFCFAQSHKFYFIGISFAFFIQNMRTIKGNVADYSFMVEIRHATDDIFSPTCFGRRLRQMMRTRTLIMNNNFSLSQNVPYTSSI
ncbi:MAG: hypothetical protein A2X81_08605 [Desulfobacterales bacterium GWB2_56_26]|nr:MAG: hypothetical protein A2X81_08605 [Desulfobacterales bacterium GWB2_56_26]